MALLNFASPPLPQWQTLRQCSSSSRERSVGSLILCWPSSLSPSQGLGCNPAHAACESALRGLDGAQFARKSSEWEVECRPFKVEELETIPQRRWNTVTVIKTEDLTSEARCIAVEAECSREIISLDDAYSYPGQLAQVKINGGERIRLPVSSPPIPAEANHNVLYKLKGDIPTGATKVRQFTLSVKAPVDLHVTKQDGPAIFDLKAGDKIELGPFLLTAMDLRPVMCFHRYPTLLFFALGKGIAIARSIIEAKDGDFGSLNFDLREEIRLYYSAPTPSQLMYKESFNQWEKKKVKVRLTVDTVADQTWDGHVGTLSQLWDVDDLDYDPETTAVVVCAEKNEEEIDRLLADAGMLEEQILKWNTNPSPFLL